MQETTTLGGGCFWCLEAVFDRLEGVESVVSGYAGGHVDNPTYQQVCSKTTGHAEVARITFDSDVISFRELLEVFFATHDPTTRDRQGNDIGPQYRSIILYESDEQRETARSVMDALAAEGVFGRPIVTELEPLERFWPAEEAHQDYYARNSRQPYCQFVIDPKVAKLRQKFADRLKADA